MTRNVVTAPPHASVDEIALLMEENGIKRIPIVSGGVLQGIVSRANIVRLAASRPLAREISQTDVALREEISRLLANEDWIDMTDLQVMVSEGVVDVWGTIATESEKQAVRIAIEDVRGVRAVNNHLRSTWV